MRTFPTEAGTPGRTRQPRRIDVTDVETAQVIEYAATREDLHFERRGGWTSLIEDE